MDKFIYFPKKDSLNFETPALWKCGIIAIWNVCGFQDEDSITAVTYVIQAILDSLSRLDLR